MKNLFLAVVVIGMISVASCKNESVKDIESETEQTGEDAADAAGNIDSDRAEIRLSEVETVEIPQFENENVQNFAAEYAKYIQELLKSSKAGDDEKMFELTKQQIEWNNKASELAREMSSNDKQKWTEWTNRLRDMINSGE